MAISFKGAHFPKEVILMGVRWYVAYPLSTRHVEELMEERGVDVDHSTINRWTIKYSPLLEEAFHRRKRSVWVSWRMELLFKQWKSLLHLHVLTGTRPERIQCLLYGRLITITMLMRFCAYASWYASAVLRREISLHKLIVWLQRTGRFAQAMHDGTVETLCRDLRRDIVALLCKQKRKRKTSQQLLATCGPSRESCSQGEMMPADQAA